LIQPSGYSQSVNASPVDKRGGGLNFGQRLSTGEWFHRPDNASMTGDRQRKGICEGWKIVFLPPGYLKLNL
jgi:hypothetical protein